MITGLDVDPGADRSGADGAAQLRPPADRGIDELRAWRERAARGAGLLPTELCSDSELTAIAAASPMSAEALAAVTGLGMLTASRLFPAVRAALDGGER